MSFILCFFAFLKKKVMYTFGEQKEKKNDDLYFQARKCMHIC